MCHEGGSRPRTALPQRGADEGQQLQTYDRAVPDDAPQIPPDLHRLQQAWNDAHAQAAGYAAAVEAERRELFPDPDGTWNLDQALLRRQWPPEREAELERLRAVEAAALKALYGHPATVAAMRDGTWKHISTALKKATTEKAG